MGINLRFEIRIAGFGGQGVVTVGRILGIAFSVYEKQNSVNTQSYGPESRGGACKSEVVVSGGNINYPYVRLADVLVALSQVALDTYGDNLKKGGILMVDPNSVSLGSDQLPYRIYRVPSAEIAQELGTIKYQNTVALGALGALLATRIRDASLRQALEENVPPKTRSANLSAYERGKAFIMEHYPDIG